MSRAPEQPRRDFLMVSAFSGLAVAAGAGAWGLGRSMAPDAAVREERPRVKINLNNIPEGSQITVKFDGKPWAIRHRTRGEIANARAVVLEDLNDPLARNAMLDPNAQATDENRAATPDGRFIVVSVLCTYPHRCVVMGDRAGAYDGWFCACCASHFDAAGRIRQGLARQNLPIPPFKVGSDLVMTLEVVPLSRPALDRLIYG